jgi:two-component system, chemotaxis family, CheB/CheR fusion protein
MARLLLVDDDPGQIQCWRLLLENSGHRIETAGTLAHAMEELSSGAPDVLVMDLRLPDLKDGLALIRRAGERASTRIVVLSGWPQDLESLPERKLVQRVLAKPVKLPALLRAISEVTTLAAASYGIFLALL